jgi:hypothetical protein
VSGRCLKPCVDHSECSQGEVCFIGFCEIGDLRPDLLGDAMAGDAMNGDSSGSDPGSAVCGDGTAQGTEACDGADLLGKNGCTDFNYDAGGPVGCLPTCAAFDLSACTGPRVTCGNNNAQQLEQCDGVDLQGFSCGSLGYAGGVLVCRPNCSFDVTGCLGP